MGGTGSPCNTVAGAEAYLHAKFYLDPSNCLATIHQRYKQDGQDIGRTVFGQPFVQDLSSSLDVGRKEGRLLYPFCRCGSPFNTVRLSCCGGAIG